MIMLELQKRLAASLSHQLLVEHRYSHFSVRGEWSKGKSGEFQQGRWRIDTVKLAASCGGVDVFDPTSISALPLSSLLPDSALAAILDAAPIERRVRA